MQLSSSITDEVCVFILEGNLLGDNHSAEIREHAEQALEQGVSNFLVDLSNLNFMNSSGIKILLQLLTSSRNAGGDLVLCGLNENISKVLLFAKLNSIFTIEPDRQIALKQLKSVSGPL